MVVLFRFGWLVGCVGCVGGLCRLVGWPVRQFVSQSDRPSDLIWAVPHQDQCCGKEASVASKGRLDLHARAEALWPGWHSHSLALGKPEPQQV